MAAYCVGGCNIKCLWVGDAGVSTGFARCTHAVCDELHARGHEVQVLAMNFFGNPQIQARYPYELWPAMDLTDGGQDTFGETRLPRMVRRFQPDVIVLLNDPWNIAQYLERMRVKLGGLDKSYHDVGLPPVVGWLAVDAENNPSEHLNYLEHVVTWTNFGSDELVKGGYTGPTSVVPLGVDVDQFRPVAQAHARSKILPVQVPADSFIVGMVGRNQPRKRLDLALCIFGKWITEHQIDDAYIYMHVAPTGEQGCELAQVASHYGCAHRLIKATPTVGLGATEETMPLVYNSFDVYLNTSSGEGFGLPALEAMACGVPCVVSDFSGLGEWTGESAVKVPCSSMQLNAPLNSFAYTIGGVMDIQQGVNALNSMYRNDQLRNMHGKRGQNLATFMPWSKTGNGMADAVEQTVQNDAQRKAAEA